MNERQIMDLYRSLDPDPAQDVQKRVRALTGNKKVLFVHRWRWAAICVCAVLVTVAAGLFPRQEARLPQEVQQFHVSHYAYYHSLPLRSRELSPDALDAVNFPYYQSLGE